MRKVVFCALAVLAVNANSAETCDISRDNRRNNFEQFYCLSGKYTESDKKLNEQYSLLGKKIDNETKKLLKSKQIKWLKMRNDQCSVWLDKEIKGFFVNLGCAEMLTTERTKYLEELNLCLEAQCVKEKLSK